MVRSSPRVEVAFAKSRDHSSMKQEERRSVETGGGGLIGLVVREFTSLLALLIFLNFSFHF